MFLEWTSAVGYLADCLVAVGDTRRIAISSVSGNAGVSTFARELARALGAAKQSVMLLDLSEVWDEYRMPVSPHSPTILATDPAILQDSERLCGCDRVLVELPPLMKVDPAVSPWRIAASCDLLLLVCLRDGTDRALLQTASGQLARAGVRNMQLVVNERDHVPLADDIARSVASWPLLGKTVSRLVRTSSLLRSLA